MAQVASLSESRYAVRTVRLGVALLGCAALASVWELLAAQVPGSPLYIGVLPGPIGALREMALTLALLSLAAGALMPWAFGAAVNGQRALIVSSLLVSGAILALGAQTYGAANGMHGHQMSDLRPDARLVFYLRHGGLLVYALGWLDIGWRVIRG
jgi:hypothetical protein